MAKHMSNQDARFSTDLWYWFMLNSTLTEDIFDTVIFSTVVANSFARPAAGLEE